MPIPVHLSVCLWFPRRFDTVPWVPLPQVCAAFGGFCIRLMPEGITCLEAFRLAAFNWCSPQQIFTPLVMMFLVMCHNEKTKPNIITCAFGFRHSCICHCSFYCLIVAQGPPLSPFPPLGCYQYYLVISRIHLFWHYSLNPWFNTHIWRSLRY